MRVAHNSQATDKPVALEFPIELEFRNVDFCGGRKTREPGEKPSEQGDNQQQTQPTYGTGLQGVLILGAQLYGVEVFEKQGRGSIKWRRISISMSNYNPSVIFTRAWLV